MKEKLEQMIKLMLKYQASDLHFVVQKQSVQVSIRGIHGIESVQSAMFDVTLFNYLKYIANLDLANATKPQSGNFHMNYEAKPLYFRFSMISTMELQTGVLRMLNNHHKVELHELSHDIQQRESFENWSKLRSGMVIMSGPTGSGKTTTLHALLSKIAQDGNLKIITLEDPIEIYDDRYVQLAVNEAAGFGYEEGIRQLLRHDPDVILLGEIRDANTAKMAYRCALTGHMVFSCVHARNAKEAIKRLCELGLRKDELKDTLSAICAQRLFPSKEKEGERTCVYEILQRKELQDYLDGKAIPAHFDIIAEIKKAIQRGQIDQADAQSDLFTEGV